MPRITDDGPRRVNLIDRGEVFVKELASARGRGLTVGLVPTMGALHRGHASLIARAASECDVAAVTVFVNPLQFDSAADLAAYPSPLDADLVLAGEAGAGSVFAPAPGEMWPGGSPATTVTVAGVSEGLEGSSRPGHFTGVATVVARIFNLAGPCRAYFGEKDFQQLAVVRRLVDDLGFPVEVVGCPTIREPDGLALSSRNARLSRSEREAAIVLWRAMDAARSRFAADPDVDADRLRAVMADVFTAEPLARTDYAEVVDPATLRPCRGSVSDDARLVVAAVVGGTRLIDNVAVAGTSG